METSTQSATAKPAALHSWTDKPSPRWKREHRIASVLNLRGENEGPDWYDTERAVADRLDIHHIDFHMSSNAALNAQKVSDLLDEMRDAPKLMLIHCMADSDRTGLALAL